MRDPEGPRSRTPFPKRGSGHEEVLEELRALREGDADWRGGRTFSLVYHASEEHTAFLKEAFGLYFSENALNPTAFASLRRLESEVVSMAAHLLGGDERTVGTMTSGGSESIMMAVKTYRDRARAERPGIARPEMILPISVHPAFEKAAHYLGVRPVHIPVGPDFRADVEAARKAIGENTILLVGSAPSYPQGVVDPIDQLAALARERGLGMHVDACLGGFLLPFVQRLGHEVPPFDFRVPGVTSMSADLHKYGFAAKGASVVLYRSPELRRHQFFAYTEWPGGLFASTTMAGTRPGGAIAAAWAALRALGEDGYLRMAREIMHTTRRFREGIDRIDGLRVLGSPAMSVLAFAGVGEDAPDLFVTADAMEARGWHIDRQQCPTSIHLMITPSHTGIVDAYLSDLGECVAWARAHPEAASEGTAALYGMAAKVPDRGMLRDYLIGYLDSLYRDG